MHSDKKQLRIKGNIALTTVILAGAILIVSGIAVLANAIDIAMTTKAYFGKIVSDTRLVSCTEESMYKFVSNTTYTGTVQITYPDGACTSVVTNQAGDTTKKILTLTATYNGYQSSRVKKVDTSTSPMTLSN